MLDWNVEQKDRSGCVVMADLFDNLNEKQKFHMDKSIMQF